MSLQGLESVTDNLAQASVSEHSDLSFSGKGLKLDNEQDGEFHV